ncbi:MAG: hypothetical protein H0Z24_05565 [Thermosipho sp. (in: Bacteria)]|nr:hypothetical protein [Thermosipho sp. (in: thermotogales)]
MKCVYCGKEIKQFSEDYELFGCDGDFIHTKCRPKIEKEMDRVLKMTDKEFYEWIGIKDI